MNNMNTKFKEFVEELEPKFQQLVSMAPVKYGALPQNPPKRAIYLFSENGEHLYVGRTNNLRNRLRGHCSPSSQHFSAVFAFRIAREVTGFVKASYKPEGSRANLCKHPDFGPAFLAAKHRVGNMDIRYVEESNPVKQALLESYVATVLETRYNDFENH
jgi:GIY-YIG catalytic domain